MFEFSEKVLVTVIKTACENEIELYTDGINELAQDNCVVTSEEDINNAIIEIRKGYFNHVFNELWTSFEVCNPEMERRKCFALSNPSVTGLPNIIDAEYINDVGITAGCAFAICFYAITNNKIDNDDIENYSELNDFQNCLMNRALEEIDLSNSL